jgi:hypothetical protein
MKAINVGNLTFAQYIGKRLMKDGLGYVPTDKWLDGCTDTKTYIMAVIPKTVYDFLVYAHELGHCKARQKPKISRATWFGNYTDENTLYNEFMAWDWALRYMRRLGMIVSKEQLKNVLEKTLGNYIKYATGCVRYANNLVDQFSAKWGVTLPHIASPKDRWMQAQMNTDSAPLVVWGGGFEKFPDTFTEVEERKKKLPANWKPWHDLVEAKSKKYHRNKKFI